MLSFQDVIRSYSRTVSTGHADTDLTPVQRRLTHVLLNLASNAGIAGVSYPPHDEVRTGVIRYLSGIAWDARPLLDAVSPKAGDAFSVALDRAIESLRNM